MGHLFCNICRNHQRKHWQDDRKQTLHADRKGAGRPHPYADRQYYGWLGFPVLRLTDPLYQMLPPADAFYRQHTRPRPCRRTAVSAICRTGIKGDRSKLRVRTHSTGFKPEGVCHAAISFPAVPALPWLLGLWILNRLPDQPGQGISGFIPTYGSPADRPQNRIYRYQSFHRNV